MISMALQRDVPQYMAMPWFITCVMARTISAGKKTNKYENSAEHQTHPKTPVMGLPTPHCLSMLSCSSKEEKKTMNSVKIKRSVPRLFANFYQLAIV